MIKRIFGALKKQLILILFLFPITKSFTQCNPTVIFKEDFGTGATSYGPPLAAGITSYTYNAQGSLADGQYAIRNTAAPSDGSSIYATWHTGFEHTGNSGYMMIINASISSGKFYEKQIDNLCSGSTIKFSAWLANLLKAGVSDPLDPNVKFEIKSALNGTILSSYTTGIINRYSTFTWGQFGFNIVLPVGETSVILTIYNNQAGGLGNDLVMDDIEFSVCGSETNPASSGGFNNTNNFCKGSNITLQGNITNQVYANPKMQWQYSVDSLSWQDILGAIQVNYTLVNSTVADSKWYRLIIAEAGNINATNCRTVSPTIKITVYDSVPVNIISKDKCCVGDTVAMNNQTVALQYAWTGPNGFSSTQSSLLFTNATQNISGQYNLQTTTNGGCINSGSKSIQVIANSLTIGFPDTTILLCNNSYVTLSTNNANIKKWDWNTGATTSSINTNLAGLYWLQVTDSICYLRDSVTIKTNRIPVVNLGGNKTICFNDFFILNAADPAATSYLWNTNSVDSALTITASGNYSVVLTNECGTATDQAQITVQECANQIFVPTAFTPNDDSKNDVLKAKAYFLVTDFIFRIYNKWGQVVFITQDPNKGWNGEVNNKKAATGVYIWELSYKKNAALFQQNGTTLLIR